jgi:heptosyltransferase-2
MKRWTRDGFLRLAAAVKRRIRRSAVILYGGPSEREMLADLARRLKGKAVAAGPDLPVRDFAAHLTLSDVVVTGDSLALHLSLAMGRRVVAYFGPTSDAEIELYGLGEKVLPLEPCGCYYRPDCSQDVSCMERLKMETLLEAVERQGRLLGPAA